MIELYFFTVFSSSISSLFQILKVRFPSDLRIKEVKRLLSSSEPVRIAIEQKPEVRLVIYNYESFCDLLHEFVFFDFI